MLSQTPHISSISSHSRKSLKPDKPNEDFILIDQHLGLFTVCDGVSRTRLPNKQYPIPSPSAEAAALFAKSVHKYLDENGTSADIEPIKLLRAAYTVGNEEVRLFNSKHFPQVDFGVNDYAATAALTCWIKGSQLHYVSIADCMLFVERTNLQQINANQTERIEAFLKGKELTDNFLQTVRRDIRNQKDHPDRWGAITGEESALSFIETGNVQLNGAKRVFLCSDGVLAAFKPGFPDKLYSSASSVLEYLENSERAENGPTDDKSLVIIELKR